MSVLLKGQFMPAAQPLKSNADQDLSSVLAQPFFLLLNDQMRLGLSLEAMCFVSLSGLALQNRLGSLFDKFRERV